MLGEKLHAINCNLWLLLSIFDLKWYSVSSSDLCQGVLVLTVSYAPFNTFANILVYYIVTVSQMVNISFFIYNREKNGCSSAHFLLFFFFISGKRCYHSCVTKWQWCARFFFCSFTCCSMMKKKTQRKREPKHIDKCQKGALRANVAFGLWRCSRFD